ncbi:hypothetical protein ACOMHN_037201 [Nucella lapillus]
MEMSPVLAGAFQSSELPLMTSIAGRAEQHSTTHIDLSDGESSDEKLQDAGVVLVWTFNKVFHSEHHIVCIFTPINTDEATGIDDEEEEEEEDDDDEDEDDEEEDDEDDDEDDEDGNDDDDDEDDDDDDDVVVDIV